MKNDYRIHFQYKGRKLAGKLDVKATSADAANDAFLDSHTQNGIDAPVILKVEQYYPDLGKWDSPSAQVI